MLQTTSLQLRAMRTPQMILVIWLEGNSPSLANDEHSEMIGEVINDGSSQPKDMEPDELVQSTAPSGNMMQPTVNRPTRDRKPNVKYNTEEYDLSEVSAYKKNLFISGLYVKQGRQKDRGRC